MSAHTHGSPGDKPWLRTGYRLAFIGLVVVLMASGVYVVGTSWLAGQMEAELGDPPSTEQAVVVPVPTRMDVGSLAYLDWLQRYTAQEPAPDKERTLEVYYSRRVFDGAPPWIPHPVEDAMAVGGASCLQCHQTGGYVPSMEAYAPVVPHPELSSCTQCHVAQEPVETLFAANRFQPPPPPELGGEAFPGAPPPVPHALQLRENCAACHGGPAAPKEIRTDHADRGYCLQCHVARHEEELGAPLPGAWNPSEAMTDKESAP